MSSDGDVVLDRDARRRLRHDVRTPLTIIAGFADVLQADRPLSDAERRDFAGRIRDAAEELRGLLDALLD